MRSGFDGQIVDEGNEIVITSLDGSCRESHTGKFASPKCRKLLQEKIGLYL